MPKIDYFAKTFSENVREVESFYNLLLLTLINDEKKIESALAFINHADLAVAPLVICVFV